MPAEQFVIRGVAATSLFLYGMSWYLLFVGSPLVIERMIPPGHPEMDVLSMVRFTTFVIIFNGTLALGCAFVAKRVANRNRFIIGGLGIAALFWANTLFPDIDFSHAREAQTPIDMINLWHAVLLISIGGVLVSCTVILTWRGNQDGIPAKCLYGKTRHLGLLLGCLVEPLRQGTLLLNVDKSSPGKLSITMRLWVLGIGVTLILWAVVVFCRGLTWGECAFLSGMLVIAIIMVTCLSWLLDLSLRFRKIQTNLADTMLSLAVVGAPVIPLLGLGVLLGGTDALRQMTFLKKEGLSVYTILSDKYMVGSQSLDFLELISTIGIEIAILVVLVRATVLADLLVPHYQSGWDKILSAMGFASATTIAVCFLVANLGLTIEQAYLVTSLE